MYSIKLFFLLCKWEFCNNNFKVTFCNTRKIDYIFILKKTQRIAFLNIKQILLIDKIFLYLCNIYSKLICPYIDICL